MRSPFPPSSPPSRAAQAIVWFVAILGGVGLMFASAHVGSVHAKSTALQSQEAFSGYRTAGVR